MTQEEVKNHVIDILQTQLLLNLATCSNDTPWCCTLEFVSKGTDIYWKSDRDSLHSKNIEQNKNVAGTINLPLDDKNRGIGIQFAGNCSPVETSEFDELNKLLAEKRGKILSQEIVVKENSRQWYKASFTKCYLLHEPLLGYERIELSL
jgi:uncharacterized protein YhbP (UPF0306 family)